MEYNLEKSLARSQQLDIDRNMIGILSVFAGLGICLVITIIVASSTLSALRGFGTMQTHWTGARKEASFQLTNYIQTSNPVYSSRFDSSMQFINTASKVLNELLEEQTNNQIVRDNLIGIRTVPDDVPIMITAFERFHNFGDFSESVQIWNASDQIINEMKEIALTTKSLISSGLLTEEEKLKRVQRVHELENTLTQYQYDLASTLASGTRLLTNIITWGSVSLGLLMLFIGGFLSARFVRSVKNWQLAVKNSEQRFRSLFDQNPNAVFSISKEGNLVKANKEFENITGYSFKELENKSVDRFFKQSELGNVQKSFQISAQGIPQTFETEGIRKNGDHIYVEVTHVPIYIEGTVTGVFGILHDITERKEAERKVNEQLEEKNHLLSEVHDRVKNNLALMSGLIQLEHEFNDFKDEKYLESTVSRIHSMALVHEKLYHTHTFSSLRMDDYVKELSETIRLNSDFNTEDYKLKISTEPVTLTIKEAIPTGLLLNELLMNTYKFAFVNSEKGKVEINLYQDGAEICLQVSDDGIGLPADFSLEAPSTMGMRLITILSEQLNASLDFESKNGTTFTIRFNSYNNFNKSHKTA